MVLVCRWNTHWMLPAVDTREVLERVSRVVAPSPAVAGDFMSLPSPPSLGKRFGPALALLFPSQPFCPLISLFCSLHTCYLRPYRHHSSLLFPSYFYRATSPKHLTIAAFPSSLSITHSPTVLHTSRRMVWLCFWRVGGDRLLWLQRNLCPSGFEDILPEVLHPSWPSKHHLK